MAYSSLQKKRKSRNIWLIVISLLFFVLLGVVLVSAYLVSTRSQEATRSQAAGFGQGATLQDYWNDSAEWKLEKTLFQADNPTWNPGYTTHAAIKVHDGSWYLLSRTILDPVSGCEGNPLGMEIRVSKDQGATFSDPITMVAPQPNTAWACAVTDGSLIYNAEENRWLYLAQCLPSQGSWRGCLFERKGADPMGPFTRVRSAPVIVGGSLWGKICADGKRCRTIAKEAQVTDEGTFDIFEYKNGFYYVSFHGFSNPYGFRGIAKTKDFSQWITTANDLPNDAFLSKDDTTKWREEWQKGGSIGVGYAQTIKQGDYYYTIAEASDINLLCTSGQNWNLGLFRSKNLNHRNVEQLPMGNPFYYSSRDSQDPQNSLPCNVQYPHVFVDKGETYLSVLRNSTNPQKRGLYIYKLEKKNNALNNGSLWKCNAESWQRITSDQSITNLAVYRNPDRASDGNCYLATNCGSGACNAGNSVYQDFQLAKKAQNLEFGAKIRTSSGKQAKGRLVLWELAPQAKPHVLPISQISGEYVEYKQTVSVNPDTTQFRFEFYLEDPVQSVGDYELDEAFVRLL